jgi:hypothetical protein
MKDFGVGMADNQLIPEELSRKQPCGDGGSGGVTGVASDGPEETLLGRRATVVLATDSVGFYPRRSSFQRCSSE